MLRLTGQLARVSSSLVYKSLALTSYENQKGKLSTTTEVKNNMGSYVYIPKNHGKDYLTETEV